MSSILYNLSKIMKYFFQDSALTIAQDSYLTFAQDSSRTFVQDSSLTFTQDSSLTVAQDSCLTFAQDSSLTVAQVAQDSTLRLVLTHESVHLKCSMVEIMLFCSHAQRPGFYQKCFFVLTIRFSE